MFGRYSPRAKRTLELALREALALGHNYVGTEHLLLGLLREDEGVAGRVLGDMGVGYDQVREWVTQRVGYGNRTPERPETGIAEEVAGHLRALMAELERRATAVNHQTPEAEIEQLVRALEEIARLHRSLGEA